MQRRWVRRAATPAAMLAALALLAAAGPAAANGLPARIAGDRAGSLVPRQETSIRVDSEDLAFVLAPDLASARVTATYRMTNPGGAPAETGIAFVLADSGIGAAPQARVEVDGAPVPHRPVPEAELFAPLVADWLAAHPAIQAALDRAAGSDGLAGPAGVALAEALANAGVAADDRDLKNLLAFHRTPANPTTAETALLLAPDAVRPALAPWADRGEQVPFLNPVTGQMEQVSFFGGGQTQWLLFAVDFPPGATRTVTVSYTHRPAVHSNRYANHVYQYEYLLAPARNWAGFGDLTVTVRVPAAASLASTLPLAEDGRRVYRGQFDGLPDADLTFSVMSRRGLIPGVADTKAYLGLLVLLPAVAGAGTGWLLGRRWARIRSWVARFLLTLIGSGGISLLINGLLLALVLTTWPVQVFQTGYNVLLAVPAAMLGALISVVASSVSMARAARQGATA